MMGRRGRQAEPGQEELLKPRGPRGLRRMEGQGGTWSGPWHCPGQEAWGPDSNFRPPIAVVVETANPRNFWRH